MTTPTNTEKTEVTTTISPQPKTNVVIQSYQQLTSSKSKPEDTASGDANIKNDVGGVSNITSSPLTISVHSGKDKGLQTKFQKLMFIAQEHEQRRTSLLGEYPASEVFREYFQSEKEIRKLSIQKSLRSSGGSGPGRFSDARPSISIPGVEENDISESQGCEVCLSRESSEILLPEVGYRSQTRCGGNCWKHLKGIVLAIFSAMQISFAAYLASYLYKERYYSIPVLVVTRFFSIFTLSAIFMPFYINANVGVISTLFPLSDRDKKCAMLRLFFRSFLGTLSGIFQYTSYKYITVADSSVIMYCNPVFVAFGARIFLNEEFSICQTITALLAIVGVVLIARPPFLNIVGLDRFDDKQLIGLGYALAAMFTLTSAILLLRSLREVHFSLLNSFFGMVGLLIAFVVAVATDELTRTEEITRLDLLILVTLGILSFGGIVAMTFALHYEQAGPVATARSTDIIFSFFWQMISGIYPDELSIGGSVLVLTCVSLTSFYKYVGGLHPTHALRKRLWFVLK